MVRTLDLKALEQTLEELLEGTRHPKKVQHLQENALPEGSMCTTFKHNLEIWETMSTNSRQPAASICLRTVPHSAIGSDLAPSACHSQSGQFSDPPRLLLQRSLGSLLSCMFSSKGGRPLHPWNTRCISHTLLRIRLCRPDFFVHVGLSLTTAFVSYFPFLLQNFSFENSARYSICDNQVQLSSDESPYCAIPTRS